MGYEIDRFIKQPNKTLICPTCSKVFQNPVQCLSCQKVFCQPCINSTVMHVKCKNLGFETQEVNNFFLNKLNKLNLKCQFYQKGCQFSSQLLIIDEHCKKCAYNTDKPIKKEVEVRNQQTSSPVIQPEEQIAIKSEESSSRNTPDIEQEECSKCHAKLYPQDLESHNCIQFLFTVIQHQNSKYATLQNEYNKQILQNQLLQNEYEEYKVESEQQVIMLEKQMHELKNQINILNSQLQSSALSVNSSHYMNLSPEQQAQMNAKKYIEQCQESLGSYHRLLQTQMQAMVDKTAFAFNNHKQFIVKTQKERFSNQSLNALAKKMALSNINSRKDLSKSPTRSKTPPPKRTHV